jgi:transposase
LGVAVGVDSHKSSFAVAVVDEVGRDVGVRQFLNNPKGHSRAIKWITGFDLDVVGIEGSGNYGAGLARALLAAGITVQEVPPFLTARERRRTPSQGKSDPADARAIARSTLRGEGLCDPMHDGPNADLKLLVDHRDQLIRARQRVANRTHTMLARNFPGYEGKVARLSTKKGIRAARTVIATSDSVAGELIADNLTELEALDARIAAGEKRIAEAVAATGTSLSALKGIAALTAAKFLGEVNDPRRLRSDAAFAMLNGSAPLPASSGNNIRHRLNRGGNRQLNRALHIMAMTLRRCDEETKTYFNRRLAEGKTKREAMRALKRHLSDVVYRCLMADLRMIDEAA